MCVCIVRYTALAYRSWPCLIWPFTFLSCVEHEEKCVRDLALRDFVTVKCTYSLHMYEYRYFRCQVGNVRC